MNGRMAPSRKVPDGPARQALVEQLCSDDPSIRHAAFTAVEQLAHDSRWRARRWASGILSMARSELRETTWEALAEWQARGLPILLELLNDRDIYVRDYAVMALCQEPCSFPAWYERALKAGSAIRSRLAFCLACRSPVCWADPQLTVEVLRRLQQDPDEETADWANFALREGQYSSLRAPEDEEPGADVVSEPPP